MTWEMWPEDRQQQMTHQEARRREAEEAFSRVYLAHRGWTPGRTGEECEAFEQDWEHIAWEMGILDHYKRLRSE